MIPFSFLSFILLFLFHIVTFPSRLHMFSMLFMCACWRFYHHRQWCKQDQILKLMCHSRSLWRRAWQHNTRPQWARPRPRPIFWSDQSCPKTDGLRPHHWSSSSSSSSSSDYALPPRLGIKRWCCLTSVCLTSVAYIRPTSRTGRPRKTKIGTEIAHFTRDADTTFKVKRSRSQGRGYIVAASRKACSFIKCNIKSHNEQLTNRTCKARWELSHSPELHSYNTAWDKSNDAHNVHT